MLITLVFDSTNIFIYLSGGCVCQGLPTCVFSRKTFLPLPSSFRICFPKGTLLHCWWECKLVQSLWKIVWRFLRKLKIELPYDPAISLLGIYPDKTVIQKYTCTPPPPPQHSHHPPSHHPIIQSNKDPICGVLLTQKIAVMINGL